MYETVDAFERRKHDHIERALDPENQAVGLGGFETIRLEHEALPELNFDEVQIQGKILGHPVRCPIFISGMTAGFPGANPINLALGEACEARGWAMGVGSQRRELADTSAVSDWKALRKLAPHALIMGNLGISQLIHANVSDVQRMGEALEAQTMVIHLNALQECIQHEGTPQFRGGLRAIEALVAHSKIPVVVKETGCGISAATARRLKDIGVAAVDVSGLGGTHWGRIEGTREPHPSSIQNKNIRRRVSHTFRNWGISTIESLISLQSEMVMMAPTIGISQRPAAIAARPFEVWASGGVRSGLDAAKCLALGAQAVGVAKPALEKALEGTEALAHWMETLEYELKTALFCTGSETLEALRERKVWIKI